MEREIKIKESFKKTKPSLNKLNEHLEYYYKNKKFMKPIVVDKNNMLIDGYITYLIARMFDIKEIEVITPKDISKAIVIISDTLVNVTEAISISFTKLADSFRE